MNSHITGIGGVFFRTSDPDKTRNWYQETFGLKMESWGCIFKWRDYENPSNPGSTTWGPFKNETDYFGSTNQAYMINYRVRDLELLLKELSEKGILPVKEMEIMDYGKFAWIEDCNGIRMELWEPVDSAFGI
ncbi:MAG: VOC family protein [Bacteroidetes bacterium]|nr:VOC family protein [Bacteroidota bacterium]